MVRSSAFEKKIRSPLVDNSSEDVTLVAEEYQTRRLPLKRLQVAKSVRLAQQVSLVQPGQTIGGVVVEVMVVVVELP
jgi:hypothetical protein